MSLNKKSQIITIDLFLALFVVTLLISIIGLYFYRYSLKLNQEIEYNDMVVKTFQITNMLIKNQGKPTNWEQNISNLEIIGLASSDRILSESKIEEFTNLSYNLSKTLLNIQDYDFYFEILDLEGEEIYDGGEELEDHSISVAVERRVIYFEEEEKNESIFKFILWK